MKFAPIDTQQIRCTYYAYDKTVLFQGMRGIILISFAKPFVSLSNRYRKVHPISEYANYFEIIMENINTRPVFLLFRQS